MKLHEVIEALNATQGEYNARTASHPRMATWKIAHKYWSKGEISRTYLELEADGKRYPIGYLNTNTLDFTYSPAGSYPIEPMKQAKAAIETILSS